jgi:hypothetical protein
VYVRERERFSAKRFPVIIITLALFDWRGHGRVMRAAGKVKR